MKLANFSVDSAVPFEIFLPKGMLNPKEHNLLYFMGKEFLTKQGSLVDLGTFLGASSYCLIKGALDSSQFLPGRSHLYCYDRFTIDDNPNIQRFITQVFLTLRHTTGRDLASGVDIEALENSFLAVFKFQCGQYLEHIEIKAGDIFDYTWEGESIDAINVDIAKTKEIYVHVLKNFFPHVRAGGGLYHQDYYIAAHYYLAISMSLLSDYVETIADKFGGGVLYQLKQPIEKGKLQEVAGILENLTPAQLNELTLTIAGRGFQGEFSNLCWAFGMLDIEPSLESCQAIEQRVPALKNGEDKRPLIRLLRNKLADIRRLS